MERSSRAAAQRTDEARPASGPLDSRKAGPIIHNAARRASRKIRSFTGDGIWSRFAMLACANRVSPDEGHRPHHRRGARAAAFVRVPPVRTACIRLGSSHHRFDGQASDRRARTSIVFLRPDLHVATSLVTTIVRPAFVRRSRSPFRVWQSFRALRKEQRLARVDGRHLS